MIVNLMTRRFRGMVKYLETCGSIVSSRMLYCPLNPLLNRMVNLSFKQYVFERVAPGNLSEGVGGIEVGSDKPNGVDGAFFVCLLSRGDVYH
jgi:hypothetical protein